MLRNNMILLLFLFVSLLVRSYPISAEAGSIVDQTVWIGGNRHQYVAVSLPGSTWDSAANDLASMLPGFHLATITSQEEQDFIAEFISNLGLESWWIGGIQDPITETNPSQGWTWVTDEPWIYTNWRGGEPNDFQGPASEQHLQLLSSDGKWNDQITVDGSDGYIAESFEPVSSIPPTAPPDGITYRVKVTSSFDTRFTDCYRFDDVGNLTIDLLFDTLTFEQKNLGQSNLFWQATSRSFAPLTIAFSGLATGLLLEHELLGHYAGLLRGNGINEFGDTFKLRGVADSACTVDPAFENKGNLYLSR